MKFVQARGYTPNRRSQPTLIVMHSMEAAEKPTTAEAVANWFAGPSAPKASAHFCLDNDSIVQCVKVGDVAWHAPGANAGGIGIELAGYARQTSEQWADAYSKAMLDLAAQLVGKLCWDFNIPLVFLDAAALKTGRPGVTTHWEVTQAFKKSTHTDPGKHFPMDELLFDADTYQVYPELALDYL
jgi:N-acetyl-anhydromuramyl-L-alanine amidase AmpD